MDEIPPALCIPVYGPPDCPTGKVLTLAKMGEMDDFHVRVRKALSDLVEEATFPCLGAKAAFNSNSQTVQVYDPLGSEGATRQLRRDLYRFTRSSIRHASEYATFIAVFRGPPGLSEAGFEAAFWQQLQELHNADADYFTWDPTVSSDVDDPQFSFSFAGQALYVIGMHSTSSRQARRFQWPTMVFNPHEQFERLRAEGKWRRMQETIRARDVALQGSINPMLSDFGEVSEARQYSGRAVDESWRTPFVPAKPATKGKCPFAH
ncbi:MAG: guanitoxin biosynthesis heme-dependent pre-guanitoxin N-hydroxylase GntA [Chthoniobacterales bacterium]